MPAAAGRHLIASRAADGDITIDGAARTFERLTSCLTGVDREADAMLRDRVNDIELIRWTVLPGSQRDAVGEVLREAQTLFDRAG